MSFEERLLMEIKNDFVTRRAARKRRLAFGGAVAVAAAAAMITVPMVITADPAYAVTRNSDGSIQITIKEFRDAEGLERELAGLGVPADITYLKPGKGCQKDRGSLVGGKWPTTPQEWMNSVHEKVAEVTDESNVAIHPQYIGKGQTLLMEISESAPAPEGPRATLVFRRLLITGNVKPCTVVDAHHELRGGPTPSTSAGH